MKNITKYTVLVFIIALVAGCAGRKGNYVRVNAGEMHSQGSWDGVYNSQAYGRMEFTQTGSSVNGLYEAERWHGRIEGEAVGDVLFFRWTQWSLDTQGRSRETRGNGYFRYAVEQEGTPDNPRYAHFLRGEWGYNDDNAGNRWEAVKFPEGTRKVLTTQPGGEEDTGRTVSSPLDVTSGAPAPSPGSSGSPGIEDDVRDLF